MISKKYIPLLFSVIFISGIQGLFAQKDQIPLDPKLANHSERLLLKIGMISKDKPAKLKFGDFYTDKRNGPSVLKQNDAASGIQSKDPASLLFSFELTNRTGDVAKVEAASNQEANPDIDSNAASDDVSIYITTSIDPEDLWVLLMTKTPGTESFSLKNLFLTNGNDEISFEMARGEPTGKLENTAPQGIQAFMNGNPIGALQYYSGGSFSYKKFIWITDQSDPQMQLVTAAVFSAMIEIADYFEESSFTE